MISIASLLPNNIDPILTKPVPIDSSRQGLSIGTGSVKIGSMLRKLWTKQKIDIMIEGFRWIIKCLKFDPKSVTDLKKKRGSKKNKTLKK